jgi:citrate lyase subunit beta / citryl-CoA lyase
VSLRFHRSVLYVPASNSKAMEKARRLPCDTIILDLEDGVAPESKAVARDNAAAAVRSGGFGDRYLVVRVNSRDTEWGTADMAALATSPVDAILFPKVDSAADVLAYEAELGSSCQAASWVMIETAKSILALGEIAASSAKSRLACVVMGTNDLAKELGARPDSLRQPFLGMMAMTVVAARAHALSVLDGVFNDLDDAAGFAAQCQQAKVFGFDGKTLIHPRQVEPCNAVFTPDDAAIAWALRVVAAFADPQNAARGAIRVDGSMVERLHVSQAHQTLAVARAAGLAVPPGLTTPVP